MRSNTRALAMTALILVVALTGSNLTGVAYAQDSVPALGGLNARTITVTGSGQASARPDQADVLLAVVTEAQRAADALAQNSREVQGVLDALRQAGIAEDDIQTQSVQLQARRPAEPPLPQSDAAGVDGFTAMNMVRVRVRALDQLGQLLDIVTQAGANQIQGISFAVSDPDQYRSEARRAAWQDARDRATELASLAGLSLGQVMAIRESDMSAWPAGGIGAAFESAVPIAPGTESISMSIDVTWALSGEGATPPVSAPAETGTLTPTATVPASPVPEATPTPTPAGTGMLTATATATAAAAQTATPSLIPTGQPTPFSTAQASSGTGGSGVEGATATPGPLPLTPAAPAGTAVASEPALPVMGWERVVIPEIGIAFDIPAGWQQQGSEWTWAAPGPGAPRVGINWQDVTQGWRPAMLLPEGAQILQQRQEWFGLVPGTSFVVLVEEDQADGLPYQTHVVVRLGSRAYDAFSAARSAEELAQMDQLVEHILASVRFVGNAGATGRLF